MPVEAVSSDDTYEVDEGVLSNVSKLREQLSDRLFV